jgi:hemoglobin
MPERNILSGVRVLDGGLATELEARGASHLLPPRGSRTAYPFSMPEPIETAAVRTIINEAQIAALVDAFYAHVRRDAVLGPIFERAIGEEWEPHLAQMRAFWSSIVLASGRYKGNPMKAHMELMPRIGAAHFARWLNLWRQTASEILPQPAAEIFVRHANTIAGRLLGALDPQHAPQFRLI